MKKMLLFTISIFISISFADEFVEATTTIGGYGELHWDMEGEAMDFHRFIVFLNHNFDDRDTVQILAEELGKSTKSIIGKLSREGVYQKAQYVSKTGEFPITKKELVVKISDAIDGELEDLEGLENRIRSIFDSEDYKEGRTAFMEKRRPVFRGR